MATLLQLDKDPVDFSQLWSELDKNIIEVLKYGTEEDENEVGPVKLKRHQSSASDKQTWLYLYDGIYKLCSHHSKPLCEATYFRLKALFERYSTQTRIALKKHHGHKLLEEYILAFRSYQMGKVYCCKLFAYLERYWIKSNCTENEVHTIPSTALLAWHSMTFLPLHSQLFDAFIGIFEKSRDEKTSIPSQLVPLLRAFVKSYSVLDNQINQNSSDSAEDELKMYTTLFETEFLCETRKYYETVFLTVNSDQMDMLEKDFSSYLLFCATTINNETLRCGQVLEERTISQVKSILHELLILKYSNNFVQNADQYLDVVFESWSPSQLVDDRPIHWTDLQILYQLVKDCLLADNSIEIKVASDINYGMLIAFRKYFMTSVDRFMLILSAEVNSEDMDNVKAAMLMNQYPLHRVIEDKTKLLHKLPVVAVGDWFELLRAFYLRDILVVNEIYNGDEMYLSAYKETCALYVNLEPSAAEMLASVIHSLLCNNYHLLKRRFNILPTYDCMQSLKQIKELTRVACCLFEYVNEKDIFELHYTKYLSVRLMTNFTVDNVELLELENTVVNIFESFCGMEYVCKFHRLLSDKESSVKLSKNYKLWLASFKDSTVRREEHEHDPDLDGVMIEMMDEEDEDDVLMRFDPALCQTELTILVAASSAWPIAAEQLERPVFAVPKVFSEVTDSFKIYHETIHRYRKLNFLPNYSNCDVAYTADSGTTSLLNLSLYQTMILLCFQDVAQLTVQQVCREVFVEHHALPDDQALHLLTRSLVPLFELGILSGPHLVAPTRDDSFAVALNMGDSLVLNTTYNSDHTGVYLVCGQQYVEVNSQKRKKKVLSNSQVEANRKFTIQTVIVRIMKQKLQCSGAELFEEVVQILKHRFQPGKAVINRNITSLVNREYIQRVEKEENELLPDGSPDILYEYIP